MVIIYPFNNSFTNSNAILLMEEFLMTKRKSKLFTVWVGGVEINDYYLSKDNAYKLAQKYIDNGYDDVIVEEVSNEQA